MKKRAIHYYNIENYTQAYEYCEDVLDIIPDDELMNELKLDILLAQSNEALRRADRLLENYPYKEVSDEVSSLIAKAEKISPNNKNIAVIQDKCKDKLISEVADYVCKRLEERDYESANEVAEHLMRSWKGDPRAEMLYKFVKEHSPRRWRR